jgi:hypothetical protein
VTTKEFPVIQETAEMIRADQQMGSKDRLWVELPRNFGVGLWLFNEPRPGAGSMEHVTEKLTEEIADCLDVPCAKIELARVLRTYTFGEEQRRREGDQSQPVAGGEGFGQPFGGAPPKRRSAPPPSAAAGAQNPCGLWRERPASPHVSISSTPFARQHLMRAMFKAHQEGNELKIALPKENY